MRVVIADDSSIARGLLESAVVIECGFELVGKARNGQESIELCRKLRPDLAILDNNMPPILGEEAARQIIANGYAKDVILASLSQDTVAKWKREGKKALAKPFKPTQLAKQIKALL
jgi:chemotaxis response regulator CheB